MVLQRASGFELRYVTWKQLPRVVVSQRSPSQTGEPAERRTCWMSLQGKEYRLENVPRRGLERATPCRSAGLRSRLSQRQVLHSIPHVLGPENLDGEVQIANGLPDGELELVTVEET